MAQATRTPRTTSVTMNMVVSGACEWVRSEKKTSGSRCCHPSRSPRSLTPSGALLFRRAALLAPLEGVHGPRARNQEERRQEMSQQRVEPDQRDVEADQPYADPERAQRTVRFQERAST